MAGECQVGVDLDVPGAVGVAPVAARHTSAIPAVRMPAAQTTVRVAIRSVLSPFLNVTPRRRCRYPRALADGHAELATLAALAEVGSRTRRPRARRHRAGHSCGPGSIRRKSRFMVWRERIASCPQISTPVGPAPTTTKVSHSSRAAGRPRARPPRRRRRSGGGGQPRPPAFSARTSSPATRRGQNRMSRRRRRDQAVVVETFAAVEHHLTTLDVQVGDCPHHNGGIRPGA